MTGSPPGGPKVAYQILKPLTGAKPLCTACGRSGVGGRVSHCGVSARAAAPANSSRTSPSLNARMVPPRPFALWQQLAGVEDPPRIERRLDAPHHVEFRPAAPFGHQIGLEAADAVLGREAAVEQAHDGVDGVHQFLVAGEKGAAVSALRLYQVEMDVAVAEMAERYDANARHQSFAHCGGAADQLRHLRDRYRDVVLDRGAGAFLR